MTEEANGNNEVVLSLHDTLQQEIDETQRELREIALMLEQSQVEVEKLSQRNATITMHLQQVETQLEALPKSEIKNAYDAALDAQQRLVVMRGQLEKLQSEQSHLQRYLDTLNQIKTRLDSGKGTGTGGLSAGSGVYATAEMLIQAPESERQRLSRQMHDGPAQALSNFILQTEIAMRLFDVDQEKARDELSNLKVSASTTFQQVRDFIFDLRPMMLDDLGLAPTIKRYCNAFREKNNLDVVVSVTGSERRLESYLEVMIFRAMQELLNNAAHHSQASQVKIHLDLGIDAIRLDVEDNGKGFEPASLDEDQVGLGIKIIEERAEMLGGEWVIDSALGQGARFSLTIPAIETAFSD
jgi:two-component system sensor histidine kinase DegS